MLHVAVVLLYIYVVVGIELFVDPDEEQWGKSRCDAPEQFLSNPYALFCDARMAGITLFQILVTNDWHRIMYTAMEVTDNEFNCLYFITFFICGPLVIVNLVLAMFFNMFFAVRESAELELSKFYNETDERAKELAEQHELDNTKTQREMELGIENGFHHELPTETGIHELPNGAKILVVRRRHKSPP